MNVTANRPLDETLGHSFCYVRSSARFISPTHCDRFVSPSQSLRFDYPRPLKQPDLPETGFRAISGASVGANTSTPITVIQLDDVCNDTAANHHRNDGNNTNAATFSSSKGFVPKCGGGGNVLLDGFESTSSFSALPLQRVPLGGGQPYGPLERAFFMSGPIERGALSEPLDGTVSGVNNGGVPFSAPLGSIYVKKRRKKSISGILKALYRNFSVVPRNFISGGQRKDASQGDENCRVAAEVGGENNVQWALGEAGEDRVHVVVSEELGWLFVGIYDGFNGPDALEFLMSHLYKAMYNELEGLFWDTKDAVAASGNADVAGNSCPLYVRTDDHQELKESKEGEVESKLVKRVMFGGEEIVVRRRRLWDFLVEDDPEDGLDLSGSERFVFSVDDALSVNNAGSAVSRSSLLLSKLKHGLLNRHKNRRETGCFLGDFGWRGNKEEWRK